MEFRRLAAYAGVATVVVSVIFIFARVVLFPAEGAEPTLETTTTQLAVFYSMNRQFILVFVPLTMVLWACLMLFAVGRRWSSLSSTKVSKPGASAAR